jgi:hypothetical protein
MTKGQVDKGAKDGYGYRWIGTIGYGNTEDGQGWGMDERYTVLHWCFGLPINDIHSYWVFNLHREASLLHFFSSVTPYSRLDLSYDEFKGSNDTSLVLGTWHRQRHNSITALDDMDSAV